jgi:NAD(P)-dependent dehydrogenase (short-subunit alcohol dehydrogenase family)
LAELRAGGAPDTLSIEFAELDLESTQSVDAFVAWLIAEHGTVDVLVNNAGVDFGQYYPEGDSRNEGGRSHADGGAPTMRTNFTQTALLTDTLLRSAMNTEDGRIVFVASEAGTYGFAAQPRDVQERVETASREELDALAADWVKATQEEELQPPTFGTSAGINGYPYAVSKMLIIRYSALTTAFSRAAARSVAIELTEPCSCTRFKSCR